MKKFMLAFALLIGAASFYNNTASAQTINISINLGRQPAWGPVGYDYAGFYYFPEINCYYDVNIGMFYYVDRGYWVSARYLPYAYRNYDLYRLYKVVLNDRNPWRYNYIHHRDYGRYRGYNYRQVVIRDSRDYRYNDSRRNTARWYSSDRYSVNRHDDRYSYNRNDNRRSEYNNAPRSNNQSSRPSYNYQEKDNSRSNNDRYQTENRTRENKEYNRGQSDRRQESRPSTTSRTRENTSSSGERKQNVERNTRNNDNNSRSSSRGTDFRLASNERTQRSR